ncbi:MAG TPA: DUF1566 domain-containing protein [Thermodesulfovibrionales bacterium]|nr:DUF1566 domain-containing protein [Thermodesulfovibrionales bacterium]
MKRIGILLGASILVLWLSVSIQATLVDMNDGTVYDTATQLSWLKNANSGGSPMNWDQAVAWAASLNSGIGFAGLKGWRLPETAQPDATCSYQAAPGDSFPLQGYGHKCTGSEMGHLYYVSLGNTAGGLLTNRGPFENIQADDYWSGTAFAPNTESGWFFFFFNGLQNYTNKATCYYVWAVRPGARVQSKPMPPR